MTEKEYNVEVSQTAQEIYLSFNQGWKLFVGHLIKINDLEFSIIALNAENVIISEFKTGAKLFERELSVKTQNNLQSLEQFMMYIEMVITPQIIMIIERTGAKEFSEAVDKETENVINRIGEKPSNETVYVEI